MNVASKNDLREEISKRSNYAIIKALEIGNDKVLRKELRTLLWQYRKTLRGRKAYIPDFIYKMLVRFKIWFKL